MRCAVSRRSSPSATSRGSPARNEDRRCVRAEDRRGGTRIPARALGRGRRHRRPGHLAGAGEWNARGVSPLVPDLPGWVDLFGDHLEPSVRSMQTLQLDTRRPASPRHLDHRPPAAGDARDRAAGPGGSPHRLVHRGWSRRRRERDRDRRRRPAARQARRPTRSDARPHHQRMCVGWAPVRVRRTAGRHAASAADRCRSRQSVATLPPVGACLRSLLPSLAARRVLCARHLRHRGLGRRVHLGRRPSASRSAWRCSSRPACRARRRRRRARRPAAWRSPCRLSRAPGVRR